MKLCSIFTPLGKIQESFYTIWLPDYLHTYLHTYFFYLPSSFAVARESLIRKKLFRSKTIFIENLWIYLLLYKLQLQIFMIITWVYLVLCNFNYKNICTQSKIGQYNIYSILELILILYLWALLFKQYVSNIYYYTPSLRHLALH